MKTRLVTGVMGILCVLQFSALPEAFAQKKVKLNAASAWPMNTEIASVFKKTFFEMVKDGTKGNIELVWKGDPSIFAARDLPSSAAAGVIDIFLSSPGYIASLVSEGGIWDSYPLYRSYDSSPVQFTKMFDIINPIYEEKAKIRLLALNNIHEFYIFTKTPVDSLRSLKGLKIRAHGGMIPYSVKAIGGVPTNIPTAEVYMALERGVVDGSARPATSLVSYKEYEITKYGIDESITWGTGLIYISLRAWNSLPSDMQKEMTRICREFDVKACHYWKERETEAKSRLIKEGKLQMFPLTPVEKIEWSRAIENAAAEAAQTLSPSLGLKMAETFKKYAK